MRLGSREREPDDELLRINLLPFVRRSVRPTGVTLNGIRYYSPILDRYIGKVNPDGSKPEYVVRFDPCDLSTIYFFDPTNQ
jgi:putative transposase